MKTNWKQTIVRVFLLALLLLVLSSYINFRIIKVDNNYAGDFRNQLTVSVEAESFSMKDLTPFIWDKMYVIKPYTSKTEMQKILGIKWTTANTYLGYLLEKTYFGEYPLDDDRFHKLIFVKDDEVILDITIDRVEADFTKIDEPLYYEDDLLVVERTPENWIFITH